MSPSSGLVSNLVEVTGGYRFCEFNSKGHIYAVRKMVQDGQPEGTAEKDLILTYESQVICPETGKILSQNTLLTYKNLKGLQLVPCTNTDTAMITFTSKQVLV